MVNGVNTLTVNSLSLGASATLDVGNSALVVNYNGTNPTGAIATMISLGYNNGYWNGAGIISSAATSDSSHATGIGYFDNGSSITIARTWYGDVNLDGMMNADDLSLMLLGQMQHGTRRQNGNINYDTRINADDWIKLMYAVAYSKGQSFSSFISSSIQNTEKSSVTTGGEIQQSRVSFAQTPMYMATDLNDLIDSP